MRRDRVTALTIALLLLAGTLAGAALAASYTPGTYAAGSQHATGIKLVIKKGSFSLKRMSFQERCANRKHSFRDQFTFVAGKHASLTGSIDSHNRFSGKYRSSGGTVKLSGTVEGATAHLNGSESSTFTPSKAIGSVNCHGSKSFDATRTSG
jgi:hypothetical protein